MPEYPVSCAERRCSATGRALRPGERYFGVMVEGPSGFARHDYATDAWSGPPDKAVGFWATKVPAGENKRPTIDIELVHEQFLQLAEGASPTQINLRYVLALLLIRRKRLRLDGSTSSTLRLSDPKTGERHDVIDPGLQSANITSLQNEIMTIIARAQG